MSIGALFPIEKLNFGRESILSALSAAELEALMEHRREQVFRKGELIFREGWYPQGIYYIMEGIVKKFKVSETGREQIFYVANTGELIGYHAVIAEGAYPDAAAALERSRIAFIPREDFLNVLKAAPAFNSRLLKILSHEFSVMVNRLSLVTEKSVRERLALQLIVLREKYKITADPEGLVAINMSREDLASLVGTATENAIRILTEFKEAGLLETRGRKIIVHNVAELIRIADYR